jgi:deoxyribonuclease V
MGGRIGRNELLRDRANLENLQKSLAESVILENRVRKMTLIAGCDVAYRERSGCAAVVVFSYPELVALEVAVARGPVDFPYVPSFLAFREYPLILQALKGLRLKPHCLIVDGHGIAHPRGAGLASHLGVLTSIPSIGCAKNCLVGDYSEPEETKGATSTLLFEGKKVGCAVRTRSGVRPVFVSPGHLIDMPTAVRLILTCARVYRTPEPLRIAHIESRRALTGPGDLPLH